MVSTVGIDSRKFVRDSIKKNGEKGHFESVIGIAIKVRDHISFQKKYNEVIEKASTLLKNKNDLQFLCFNDIKKRKRSI